MSQTLLARIVQKVAFPKSLPNVIFSFFNVGYHKDVQSVQILACSDEYLQVLGLTQPTVLTLEWIRGFFLVLASAFVVNLLLTIPQSIESGPFSLKIQIICKITVFTV